MAKEKTISLLAAAEGFAAQNKVPVCLLKSMPAADAAAFPY